jgi:ABC-type uncharacterized transport system permease subunit
MIDWIIILQAGVASGTVLLFAAIGEILAERSGVMNLGVEGMMLIGAMTAFKTVVMGGDPWLGVLYAMLAAGALSLLHALVTINFQADQVVSGLAINFVGIGLSTVLGEGLSKAGTVSLLPSYTVPLLSQIPLIGPIFFTEQHVLVYVGYVLTPAAWFYINRTRPGLHLRAVGEYPAAADALGINVYLLRYLYVLAGGLLAGLAGATISLAVSPGSGWLYVRRHPPAHPRLAGARVSVGLSQSLLLHTQAWILFADAALCAHDSRPGSRQPRSTPQAIGSARRVGHAVHPWRTGNLRIGNNQNH